jgi:hypothetical protein
MVHFKFQWLFSGSGKAVKARTLAQPGNAGFHSDPALVFKPV